MYALPKNLDFPLQADGNMGEILVEGKMIRFRFWKDSGSSGEWTVKRCFRQLIFFTSL